MTDRTKHSSISYSRRNDRTMDEFVAELQDINDECKAFLDSYYCQSEGNDISRIGMLEFSRVDDSWNYGERNFRLLLNLI